MLSGQSLKPFGVLKQFIQMLISNLFWPHGQTRSGPRIKEKKKISLHQIDSMAAQQDIIQAT